MAEAGETPRSFAWNDPFDLDGQLSEDEKLVRDKARAFAQGYLFPRVTEDYFEERFDREIVTRMGRAGLLGPAIPQVYGGAGLGHVACGLTAIGRRLYYLSLDPSITGTVGLHQCRSLRMRERLSCVARKWRRISS